MAPLLHSTIISKKRSLLGTPLVAAPTKTSQRLTELLSGAETKSKKRKPSNVIASKLVNDNVESHHVWSKWSQKAAAGASAPLLMGSSVQGLQGLGEKRTDSLKTKTIQAKTSKLRVKATTNISSPSRTEKENTENKESGTALRNKSTTTLECKNVSNQETNLDRNVKPTLTLSEGKAKLNLALRARSSASKPKQLSVIRNRYVGLVSNDTRSEVTPQLMLAGDELTAPLVSKPSSNGESTERQIAGPADDKMADFFALVNSATNNPSANNLPETHALGRKTPSASMEIPRPSSGADKEDSHKAKSNDNFVRLNLKNGAGACRGARNKKGLRKAAIIHRQRLERSKAYVDKRTAPGVDKSVVAQSRSGVDPLDDLLDGTYQATGTKGKGSRRGAAPCCSGHQQPCKLITVKKNTRGNKGRKFYACPFPRGEQCEHFEWADDTQEAVNAAIRSNDSTSGFIARQVTAYVNQIRSLTVPELRDLTDKHKLLRTGKKAELLARLAIWARDEIAKGTEAWKETNCKPANTKNGEDSLLGSRDRLVEKDVDNEEESEQEVCSETMSEIEEDDNENDDCSSSSEDELEIMDRSKIEPAYGAENGREVTDFTVNAGNCRLLFTLQSMFGFTSFREGQEWAIRRCLDQKRSCFVAPTGFGKSLCYTLPATLMDGVCIVVSPLVSLMQDQLRLLPPRIPAATLSGSLSTSAVAATVDDILRGRIKILFVSPERLTSPSFRRMFLPKWNSEENRFDRRFPTVSLLCVDEAHCMSQWAHNFRPSYMRLATMLEIIQPKSVLAMTATAGPRVVDDICRTLGIDSPKEGNLSSKSVQIMSSDRDNIDVQSFFLPSQEERLSKLVDILSPVVGSESRKSPVHGALAHGSVIVYVWRQRDAEAVAENIVAAGVEGGVVFYHGGMNSEARSRSQSKFMRGKARICVATIAFGLGINKSDVAGVIHMYLSASPEHYVQEIGRAGRDGRPAKAIALVLHDEVSVRTSLAHSDLISRTQVLGLLKTLQSLVLAATSKLSQSRETLNITVPLQDTVLSTDVKSETIETIFSLLEGREKCRLLYVHGVSYDKAVVSPNQNTLSDLGENEAVVRSIRSCATCLELPVVRSESDSTMRTTSMSIDNHFSGSSFGTYAFSVSNCSNLLGENAEPRHVYAALRRLETSGDIKFVLDTSPKGRTLGITVTKEGMQIFTDAATNVLEDLATEIFNKIANTIFANAKKVLDIDFILREVSKKEASAEIDQSDTSKSTSLECFQALVGQYFCANDSISIIPVDGCGTTCFLGVPMAKTLQESSETVYRFLKQMEISRGESRLVQLGDPGAKDYTLLAITKFLHGIPSASYRLENLRGHHLFGHLQQTHFSQLLNSLRHFF